MLRITPLQTGDLLTLRLEGKLLAGWTDELRQACAAANGTPILLDLSAVSFVDPAGTRLLHELLDRGTRLGPCSSFVQALLLSEKA
jgi:anti-anti-sigma regulatory factor